MWPVPMFPILFQGGKFSGFSLISDFFILTHLKSIFGMSPVEHVSYASDIDSDLRPFH